MLFKEEPASPVKSETHSDADDETVAEYVESLSFIKSDIIRDVLLSTAQSGVLIPPAIFMMSLATNDAIIIPAKRSEINTVKRFCERADSAKDEISPTLVMRRRKSTKSARLATGPVPAV